MLIPNQNLDKYSNLAQTFEFTQNLVKFIQKSLIHSLTRQNQGNDHDDRPINLCDAAGVEAIFERQACGSYQKHV